MLSAFTLAPLQVARLVLWLWALAMLAMVQAAALLLAVVQARRVPQGLSWCLLAHLVAHQAASQCSLGPLMPVMEEPS